MPARANVILLVDEAPLRRASVSALLARSYAPDDVVIEDMSVQDAALHLELDQAEEIVLMNVGGASLEDAQIRQSIRLLRGVAPATPLVILGERNNPDEIQMAILLGVRGYVPTTFDTDFALKVISFIRAGGSYYPTDALAQVIAGSSSGDDDGPGAPTRGRSSPGDGGSDGSAGDGGRASRRITLATRRDIDDAAAQSGADDRSADAPPPRVDRPASGANGARPCEANGAVERPAARLRDDAGASDRSAAREAAFHGDAAPPRPAKPQLGENGHRDATTASGAAILQRSRASQGVSPMLDEAARGLSKRQIEVLELLCLGKANKEIAKSLNMTDSTVKVYVRQIMRHFDVNNRTQVVAAIFKVEKARRTA